MAIDVATLLNTKFAGPANSVKRTPVPVGEWKSRIDDVELETFPGRKDPSKVYLRCNVTHVIIDEAPEIKALKREKVVMVQQFLVDLTDSGSIDFSEERNITLGRLRAATGMNTPGAEWSFPAFKGKVVKVKVGHEMFEGEPQARVTNTTAI